MDQQPIGDPIAAGISTLLSITSSTFAIITLNQVQEYCTLIATGIAMASGIMAIRYYHIAIKEKLK